MKKSSVVTNGKERKSKNVKRKIYNCAIDLFIEHGFDNVKITDICSAAQVSTGTFYYYFPSKESVFFGYAEAIDDIVESEIAKLIADTAEETLRNIIHFKVYTSTRGGAAVSNVSFIAALKHNRDVALDMHRVVYGYIMNTIAKGIANGEFRNDVDIFTITSLLRYSIGGLVLHWSIQSDEMNVIAEADALCNAIIMMLKK